MMLLRLHRVLGLMFLLNICLGSSISKAGSQSAEIPKDIGYNMSITVSVVEVTASVYDAWGRTVHGLDTDDFIVKENGERQEIVQFKNVRGLPKQLTILFDVSGSMRIMNKIGVAKNTTVSFINQLHSEDRARLIFFADGSFTKSTEFTTDHAQLVDRIWNVAAFGQTALRDAIRNAPDYSRVEGKYQRAMILITDGIDNASEVTMEEAILAARRVDLPVYILGIDPVASRNLRPSDEGETALASMQTLADQTGGRFFHVGKSAEMLSGFNQIIRDLENQYLFAFTSKYSSLAGHHEIDIKTRNSRYTVRARKGYFVSNSE